MDFKLTEEQEIFRDSVRKYAREKIAPIVKEVDEKDKFPMDIFNEMGRLGFLGIGVKEEYGGSNAGAITLCILIEELARVSSGVAAGTMAHLCLGMGPVIKFGSEAQKKKYLVPAARGEILAALAITEPNAGSDVANVQTTAAKDGKHYVINGSKVFITNGSLAQYVVVVTKTNREKKAKGVSLFIVEKGTPGFRVARKHDKLGWRGSDTAELVFEDCRVPADALVGVENEGFPQLMKTLESGRVSIAACALGQAESALDLALKYSIDRKAFGQPISAFQAIRFKLTRMATEIEAARLLILWAAWLQDNGMEFRKEAAMAKLYSSEVCQEVAREAIQIHGGYGFMTEYDVSRIYRDAMLYTIGEGTSEVQHEIIARGLGL